VTLLPKSGKKECRNIISNRHKADTTAITEGNNMGSGSRFSIGGFGGFGLAVTIDRFPHNVSITILVACFVIYMGFGKGYDE